MSSLRSAFAPLTFMLALFLAVCLMIEPVRAQPADTTGVMLAQGPSTSDGSGAPTVVAAPAAGSGSASTTVTSTTTANAAGTTTQTTIIIPDPTSDPLGFINTMKILWSLGWGAFIGGCAFGLAEIAAWLGKSGKVKALGDGRLSIVIGGVVAILSTTIAALTKQSGKLGWAAVGMALIAAALAYFDIRKNDKPAVTA